MYLVFQSVFTLYLILNRLEGRIFMKNLGTFLFLDLMRQSLFSNEWVLKSFNNDHLTLFPDFEPILILFMTFYYPAYPSYSFRSFNLSSHKLVQTSDSLKNILVQLSTKLLVCLCRLHFCVSIPFFTQKSEFQGHERVHYCHRFLKLFP